MEPNRVSNKQPYSSIIINVLLFEALFPGLFQYHHFFQKSQRKLCYNFMKMTILDKKVEKLQLTG